MQNRNGDLEQPLVNAVSSQTKSSHLDDAQKKLLIGTALCTIFMLVEIIGGYFANSLAVMTDAAHMLSDVAGFIVGVVSLVLTTRAADAKYTFGYYNAEVLGAMISIMIVWLMTGILLYEACFRLIRPSAVDGPTMFWIALGGCFMNVVLLFVFSADDDGHGHCHGHGHSHGHGSSLAAAKPRRGATSARKHGHAEHGHAEHGHDEPCCHAEHCHEEHGHAEHEHGHAEHEHGRAEHEHGHAEHEHGRTAHEHGHAEHEHGHAEHERGRNGAKQGEQSIAVRAALVHVIGDILQSLGVLLAASFIWAFSDRWLDANGVSYWYRLDPVCTIGFSFIVLSTTVGTVKDALHNLMAGTPVDVSPRDVGDRLARIPGVVGVHDLHLWALTGNLRNLWAHLVVRPNTDTSAVLRDAQDVAIDVKCEHTCFQIENAETFDTKACEAASCWKH